MLITLLCVQCGLLQLIPVAGEQQARGHQDGTFSHILACVKLSECSVITGAGCLR